MDLDQLSPGFWGAVLHVHQYLFESEMDNYYSCPTDKQDGHVFESLRILGAWLAVAIERDLIRELDS